MIISYRSPGQRGVVPIVGEILLVAIIVVAMGIIATWVVVSGTQSRFVDLEVRLENASPPYPVDNTFDNVWVILAHRGGDPLGIPYKADVEFRVVGQDLWGEGYENWVAWDNWTFSDPSDGFGIGEYAWGILRRDGWNLRIGDELKIIILDIYADKLIVSRAVTIENSALY